MTCSSVRDTCTHCQLNYICVSIPAFSRDPSNRRAGETSVPCAAQNTPKNAQRREINPLAFVLSDVSLSRFVYARKIENRPLRLISASWSRHTCITGSMIGRAASTWCSCVNVTRSAGQADCEARTCAPQTERDGGRCVSRRSLNRLSQQSQ